MENKKSSFQIENIRKIVLMFLLSLISVFLVLSWLLKQKIIINLIQSHSLELFIGLTSLNLVLLIQCWKKGQRYWIKYRETKKTEKFPLIFIELLAIYLIFTVFSVFLYMHTPAFKFSIVPSKEFNFFIIVNVLFFLIWFFSGFHCKQKSPEKSKKITEESLLDEPITTLKQDLLRRGKFVDDLYGQIVNLPTQLTGSFTFGLYGGWGEGKTSVINLLSSKLVGDTDFILIRFEPWYFQDEKAILTSFYNQLEKAFSDKFLIPDFKNTIQKYKKIISTGISFSGLNVGLKNTDLSIEQIREKIERNIDQINRKVLIIIDDIDRLHQDEMDMVFKLVRKNTNFKNTIFLLSFDHTVVKSLIINKVEGNEEFLEKIINKPILLPAVEYENIDRFILGQIAILLGNLEIPSQERDLLLQEFRIIYESDIYKFFRTLRQAKRYINSLNSTLPSIKSEVNLYDFLLLEIIKIFNTELYNDIWSNPWYYIESGVNNRMLVSNPFTFLSDKDKKKEIIKKHIDKLIGNNPNSQIFKKILEYLFPGRIGNESITQLNSLKNFGKERIEKWISHSECFFKYFTFLTPSTEISDEYIEKTIEFWKTINSDVIKSLIKNEFFENRENNKTYKLLQKLLDFIEKIDSNSSLSIIETIYENSDRFLKSGRDTVVNSEWQRAERLMLWLIKDKIEKKRIPEVIEAVIMNSPDLLFSLDVIFTLREEKTGLFSNITNSIDIKYLQNQLSSRLKEYFIDGKRDVFEIINENVLFFLYQWYYSLQGEEGANKKIINDYVISLIKDDAKKFSNFLIRYVENIGISHLVDFNIKDFEIIYSFEDFEKIARKFKNSKLLTEEERLVINKFLGKIPKKNDPLSII